MISALAAAGAVVRPSATVSPFPTVCRPMSCDHLDGLELRTPSTESLRQRARDVLHNRLAIHKASGQREACFDIIAHWRKCSHAARDRRRKWAKLSNAKKRAMAKRECIASTELPHRVINALERIDCFWVGQLCLVRAADIHALPDIAEKSVEDVRQMMAARGLALLGEEAPEPARTTAEALKRIGKQCRDEQG